MAKRIPIFFLIFVLLIVALACIVPSITTSDEDFVNTAIAQTQTAAPVIPITGPSLTPTKPPSATPFPTFTVVVLQLPQLSVSVDTICRTGPGEVYDQVGVVQPGEIAEVVGRSPDGNFWVIRNPDRTDETCWISGQNATLTGLPSIVPVFSVPPTPTATNTPTASNTPTATRTPTRTPIPTRTFTPTNTRAPAFTPTHTPTPPFTPTSTPTSSTPTASPTPTSTATPTSTPSSTPTSTPSSTPTSTPSPTSTPTPTATPPPFTASFSMLESCTGTGWWVDLALENTGGVAFESLTVTLNDTVAPEVLSFSSEDFTNRDCSTTDTQANLPPGGTRIVSSPAFTNNPTGHLLRATIVLCSSAGQTGTCMAQVISFTP